MSDGPRRLTTEEQRERLYRAKGDGDVCAACGRQLGADDVIYIECFAVPFKAALYRDGRTATVWGPVGAECASQGFLHDTRNRQPERCAGCERRMYYRQVRRDRQRALCSKRCAYHASAAARPKMRD